MFNPRVGNLQIPFTWRKTMYIGLIRASVLAANWDKWRAGPVCRWPVSWPDINLILTFFSLSSWPKLFSPYCLYYPSRNVVQPCVYAWLVNKLWQIFPITLFPSTHKEAKVRPYISFFEGAQEGEKRENTNKDIIALWWKLHSWRINKGNTEICHFYAKINWRAERSVNKGNGPIQGRLLAKHISLFTLLVWCSWYTIGFWVTTAVRLMQDQ